MVRSESNDRGSQHWCQRSADSQVRRGRKAPINTRAWRSAHRLGPSDFTARLVKNEVLQKMNGLFQTFTWSHETVFVFDRKGTIVPDQAQGRNKVTPEPPWISVADGAKKPGPI